MYSTIIPPWINFQYQRLLRGVANLTDIFQQKINDLFHVFKFIRAYIDELLILTKRDWTDNVQKIELTLNKMREKGYKCYIEESFF